MDENVRKKFLFLADLILKWEIWDIDDDCSFECKAETYGGKKY